MKSEWMDQARTKQAVQQHTVELKYTHKKNVWKTQKKKLPKENKSKDIIHLYKNNFIFTLLWYKYVCVCELFSSSSQKSDFIITKLWYGNNNSNNQNNNEIQCNVFFKRNTISWIITIKGFHFFFPFIFSSLFLCLTEKQKTFEIYLFYFEH